MDQDAAPVRPTTSWLLRELDLQLEAAADALARGDPAVDLARSSIGRAREAMAQLRAELEARQAQPAAEPQAVPSSAVAPADLPASRPTASTPRTAAAPHASPYRDPQIWLMTFALSLLAGSAAFFGSRWFDERARRERAHWRSLQAKAEGAVPPPSPAPAVGIAPPVAAAPLTGAAALFCCPCCCWGCWAG